METNSNVSQELPSVIQHHQNILDSKYSIKAYARASRRYRGDSPYTIYAMVEIIDQNGSEHRFVIHKLPHFLIKSFAAELCRVPNEYISLDVKPLSTYEYDMLRGHMNIYIVGYTYPITSELLFSLISHNMSQKPKAFAVWKVF
jgi:hypothetical protein